MYNKDLYEHGKCGLILWDLVEVKGQRYSTNFCNLGGRYCVEFTDISEEIKSAPFAKSPSEVKRLIDSGVMKIVERPVLKTIFG